ncbi:hypothetical protein CYG49_03635 [Candidatus Saccharibacteria bacterium]|nr:MAG: hypothetical protein CYG49_03635 [Candidatus Saccharibacteria bacterium]
MKLVKFIGAIIIFLAGYLTFALVAADWVYELKLYGLVGILTLLYVGLACILSANRGSLKESLSNSLLWPLNILP